MARTFRAMVKGAFELTGRGTVVAVEILDGTVAAGDQVLVPIVGGQERRVAVRAIGFIDRDVGRPTQHAHVALHVDLPSAEVEVGREVRVPA